MISNALVLPASPVVCSLTVDNSLDWVPHLTWTVEFWCKNTVQTGVAVINAMPWFNIYFDTSNRLNVMIGPSTSMGSNQNINIGYIPAPNSWHHYAVVRTGVDNLNVYIDGVLYNSGGTPTLDPVGTFPTTLSIGTNGNVSLGDMRIWNYARSAVDIGGGSIPRPGLLPVISYGYLYQTDGMGTGLLANWTFPETDNVNTVTEDQAWWPAPKTVLHNATINGTGYSFVDTCPVNIATKPDAETPPVTARLDYGQQAAIQHLPMSLRNALKIFGLNADVYDRSVFQNERKSYYPEYVTTQVPVSQIKVLISQPFNGVTFNDYISLTQAATKEFKLVASCQLQPHYVIRVRFPDNRQVLLRIVDSIQLHPLSAVNFVYDTVFV